MPQPKLFADDPAAWFGDDVTGVHHMPPAEAERLQLEALNARFAALRAKLPPLDALASAQGIADIPSLDAAAPLLFPHSFYKSYAEQYLVEGAYAMMTRWLSRLTTHDLTPVAGRDFAAMDDWLDALDAETPLEMYHSSGTTGRLSFYPRGKAEVALQHRHSRMILSEWYLPDRFVPDDFSFALFWPAHAFGRSAVLRMGRMWAELCCADMNDFHALLPTALSADYHYHVMRTRNMAAQGFAFGPVATDYVKARLEEADALHRAVPQRVEEFLDIMASLGGGKRIMLAGGPANIHSLVTAGLSRGLSNVAMPGSIARPIGGYKNVPKIATAEADAMRFLGPARYCTGYGMTELTSGFNQCANRRYHVPPWIIPYVLDPASGGLLPREGVQRGRAAFFDLMPQSYWGGVITADYVEMSWQLCACGRQTPHISEDIGRIADGESGSDHIGPALPEAMSAALEALNAGLPRPN
jgi:hypothetical protein